MADRNKRKELLEREFERHDIVVSDYQADQLIEYYDLLIEWNTFMNLTGIVDFREVVIKHFVDSLTLTKAVDLDRKLTLIDVGTGAGFPGLPLKIVYPKLEVTLLDSLNKRVKFLEEVIDRLQLQGISAIHGRAEDYGKQGKDKSACLREKFDVCVSRAVANISVLSEYCIPFVKKQGLFIAYKSEKLTEELETGSEAIKIMGGTLERQLEFTLDNGTIYRNLLVVRKVDVTPPQFPRKAGTINKFHVKHY